MSQGRVVVCCWLHGHQTEMSMTLRQEETLVNKIKKLKAVCPECRNAGLGNQPIFIQEGRSLFSAPKLYKCEHGHVTTIAAFDNGMLHLCFGFNSDDFVNIEGKIEELPELIDSKDVSCHHIGANDQQCDCKLHAVDDYALTYPTTAGIKTKTRVGDLWDRAGIEPVRPGAYDKGGHYQQTRSEIANRERLKRVRKDRNIPVNRQPGRRVDRPTKTQYDRREKNSVDGMERLKGPQ